MSDTNALLDIANNGAALNQAISDLTRNVAKLSSITLPAANGGTGLTAPGANGNVLTSNGTGWVSSALPTPAVNVSSISFGTTGLTPNTASTGAVSVAGTLGVGNGGTGRSSLTQYALLAGGTTLTGNVQSVATGSSGQVLTSSGASAVPVFQTLTQSQLATAFNATGSAPFYACRAWVNFDGTKDVNGNVSTSNTNRFIRASGNVTSVLRNGLGLYTISFTTALSDANYSIVGFSSNNDDNANESFVVSRQSSGTYTANEFQVTNTENTSNATARQDSNIINVLVFR